MKKQILLAFTAALGITLSVSAPVEAASANRVNISVFEKDCATDQWNSFEADSVNDLLKKICDRFPAIVLPGECTPEIPEDDKDDQTPGTPEKPDTPEKPEENQPGGNTSGDEQPKEDLAEISYIKQVLKLVNAERKKAGLNELIWDDTVAAAAATRSIEIEKSFSHTRPDGRTFATSQILALPTAEPEKISHGGRKHRKLL